MTTDSNLVLISGILGLAALGFFAGAALCFVKTRIFLKSARRTEGVVAGNATARNSDGGETFVPVISFLTADGTPIQFTGGIGSNPPAYRAGERVRVCYPPKRPREAKIFSFFNLYWLPLMFLLFAGTFSAAMILVYFTGI